MQAGWKRRIAERVAGTGIGKIFGRPQQTEEEEVGPKVYTQEQIRKFFQTNPEFEPMRPDRLDYAGKIASAVGSAEARLIATYAILADRVQVTLQGKPPEDTLERIVCDLRELGKVKGDSRTVYSSLEESPPEGMRSSERILPRRGYLTVVKPEECEQAEPKETSRLRYPSIVISAEEEVSFIASGGMYIVQTLSRGTKEKIVVASNKFSRPNAYKAAEAISLQLSEKDYKSSTERLNAIRDFCEEYTTWLETHNPAEALIMAKETFKLV